MFLEGHARDGDGFADLQRRDRKRSRTTGCEREAQFLLEIVVPAHGTFVGSVGIDDDFLLDASLASSITLARDPGHVVRRDRCRLRLRYLGVPRQHSFVVLDGLQMWQPLEQEREVGVRFEAVGLASLDERVQIGAGDGPLDGVAEQPAFAADDKGSDRIFAAIVCHRHFAVSQEHAEFGPLTERVEHGLAEPAFRQDLGGQGLEPGVEVLHDRRALLLADLDALRRGERLIPIPERSLDQRESADELERGLGVARLRAGLAGFVKITA